MLRSVVRDERRAWKERIVVLVALVLPKLERTSGNSQREPQHQVTGAAFPHQIWQLGPQGELGEAVLIDALQPKMRNVKKSL